MLAVMRLRVVSCNRHFLIESHHTAHRPLVTRGALNPLSSRRRLSQGGQATCSALHKVAVFRTQLQSPGLHLHNTTASLESAGLGDWTNSIQRHEVLAAFYCCCRKLLQTEWLMTRHIYYFIVLEFRSPKWFSLYSSQHCFLLEAPGQCCFFAFCSIWKLPASPDSQSLTTRA